MSTLRVYETFSFAEFRNMVDPIFGRGRMGPRQRNACALEKAARDGGQDDAIRETAISLVAYDDGISRDIARQAYDVANAQLAVQRQIIAECGREEATERALIAKPARRMAHYREVFARRARALSAPDASTEPISGDSIEAYAASHEHAGADVITYFLYCGAFLLLGAGVTGVEIDVLRINLSLLFPPMLGDDGPPVASGTIVMILAVAVIAGHAALRGAGERTERAIKIAGRIALMLYIPAIGLFSGVSMIGALGESPAGNASLFAESDDLASGDSSSWLVGVSATLGHGGLAVAISMVTLFSFLAMLEAIRGFSKYAPLFVDALSHRVHAWKVLRRARLRACRKAKAIAAAAALESAIADIPRAVATHVAKVAAPILAAIESILIQRELHPGVEPVAMDALSAQAARMNKRALSKRLARLRRHYDPKRIERDLGKFLAREARGPKGGK